MRVMATSTPSPLVPLIAPAINRVCSGIAGYPIVHFFPAQQAAVVYNRDVVRRRIRYGRERKNGRGEGIQGKRGGKAQARQEAQATIQAPATAPALESIAPQRRQERDVLRRKNRHGINPTRRAGL